MLTPVCPQGKFQGLDLNEELYLGGYPDYTIVAKTGLSRGFVGMQWDRGCGGAALGVGLSVSPRCVPQAVCASCASRMRRWPLGSWTCRHMASPTVPRARISPAR